jgi:aromatic ring-opening dioxygenase LigB subunit
VSGLVFACIAPHGGMVIPDIGGAEGRQALATRAAMEELGRRMAAARPETIVLVTPHGLRIDGAFSLLDTGRVAGQLGGAGRVVSVEFQVDNALNAAIVAAAPDLPVARLVHGAPSDPASCLPLDWGAVVPFWFMGRTLTPKPRVVVACPDRRLDWALFPRFGAAVRRAAAELGRRIAFIASADLAHAHDPRGPYGFDPAAAEFDAATVEAVAAQDLGRLLTFDSAWVARAKPDALWQILNLHGALAGTALRGELLSYEAPTYFGMLCAAYE